MTVTAAAVQDLRQKTGAGLMDCKKALVETEGNVDKAIEFLRKKGLSAAEKKASREVKQGAVISYIHGGGRIGVLLEINCETDFVARNDQFQAFANDVAMHIAAMNPRFLSRDQVTSDVLDKESEIIRGQLKEQNKPDNVIDKILTGKINKYYEENCLLEQPFVKNSDQTIEEFTKEAISKLGENIVISRYVRFELGQSDS